MVRKKRKTTTQTIVSLLQYTIFVKTLEDRHKYIKILCDSAG